MNKPLDDNDEFQLMPGVPCYTCRHHTAPLNDEPCNSCRPETAHTKWAPLLAPGDTVPRRSS